MWRTVIYTDELQELSDEMNNVDLEGVDGGVLTRVSGWSAPHHESIAWNLAALPFCFKKLCPV